MLRPLARSLKRTLLPPAAPSYLDALRRAELDVIRPLLPAGARVLELGAGTGTMARALADAGYAVEAVDLPSSRYHDARVFPVRDYDGRVLPFPDGCFDAVYSASTLEHVEDLGAVLAELRRVLAPGGVAVHLVPSPTWRLASLLTELLSTRRVPGPHGVLVDSALGEVTAYAADAWRARFEAAGFRVELLSPHGLFYTGAMLAHERLSLASRRALARRLGSSAFLCVLTPR